MTKGQDGHRESRKMKKTKNMSWTKEKDKILETGLNKMEIYNLPEKKVQNNGHKVAHWNQENNAWTKCNFNEKAESLRKYQMIITKLKITLTHWKIH